mgnify:CR=1 FL=1
MSAPEHVENSTIITVDRKTRYEFIVRVDETSFVADGHIRKYDGEPFLLHHIVDAVKEQLAGTTTLSVPVHEINV